MSAPVAEFEFWSEKSARIAEWAFAVASELWTEEVA